MARADEIRAALSDVERRIAAACERSGRERPAVTLIAVTKTFPASDVSLAIEAGVTAVGENKVQEARDKQPEVAGAVRWHLIGHLQSNKAKDAVRLFDTIQTVESIALAERIARMAAAEGKRQKVMLEINIGRESQKNGVDPDEAGALARDVARIPELELTGIMAIPPFDDDPEATRRYFRRMRALREGVGVPELSIGMTDDFEVAIEEGATIVRVGRAIFGSRG